MKAAGKTYDPVTYDGAGHGFMRAGEDPGNTNPANKTAREQAFARLTKLLKEMKPAKSSAHTSTEHMSRPTLAQAPCHDSDANPAL